ncbi:MULTISPECIES: hypothetical protein [Maribacter]|jgi:hypothetical protein|uniref:Uncharacterized protein n=1 Tax=Maribacter aquivivus TaxID=228958 RepID=A0A1M6IMS0_9FLAO|nr:MULTISPECIES: hypothetical protein [Maribacter]MDF4220895.1 hypothetical protein [Maribacter huludaoensis]SHJ35643.1 hypothetical protein SAMN04488007_0073 [Maribacter aquivivus]|tara:strand:- start:9304 stop:9564 length:261 start_codon:yes stop_codon:yes gene_type:complete
MDNEQVHNNNIPDTAFIALDIFKSIIKGKIEAYTAFGHNQSDLIELNDILKINIKDMVISSKQISDEISDEDVVEFVSYYNRLVHE